MRIGSLKERLARSSADIASAERARVPKAAHPPAAESQILAEVAEALNAAFPAQRKVRPSEEARAITADEGAAGAAGTAEPEPAADGITSDLPLVLAGRPHGAVAGPDDARRPRRLEWRQLLAPALLASALVGVGVLMQTGFSEPPKPRLTRLAPPDSVTMLVATMPGEPALLDLTSPTTDDLKLLEHCEQLITRGEILAAREELGRAAAAGSAQARFALAETFDPNVLAAWGLRDDVAEASVARALYDQALAAGDRRAMPRLAALK